MPWVVKSCLYNKRTPFLLLVDFFFPHIHMIFTVQRQRKKIFGKESIKSLQERQTWTTWVLPGPPGYPLLYDLEVAWSVTSSCATRRLGLGPGLGPCWIHVNGNRPVDPEMDPKGWFSRKFIAWKVKPSWIEVSYHSWCKWVANVYKKDLLSWSSKLQWESVHLYYLMMHERTLYEICQLESRWRLRFMYPLVN